MRLVVLAAAAVLVASSLPAQDDPLRVLRHSPSNTASPDDVVTVTFDRPVAGGLDRTVEAAKILRIEPNIEGSIAWRDPVTIRFIPKHPLVPRTRLRVTVDTSFRSFDGSRLSEPYRFTFRVRGPRFLAHSLGYGHSSVRTELPLSGKIQLLFSAPVDLAALRKSVRVELPGCDGAREIRMTPVRQGPVGEDDSFHVGSARRDGGAGSDRFRRVVELEPAIPTPPDCSGALVIPTTEDDRVHGREERFLVSTAPRFRLQLFNCTFTATCPHTQLVVSFNAPVARAEVQRYVRIAPPVPLDLDEGISSAQQWPFRVRLAPRSTYTVTVDEALRDVHGRALVGPRQAQVKTSDYVPMVEYAQGSLVMTPARTIPVRHVNVRSVRVITYRVPDRLRTRVMSVGLARREELLQQLSGLRPDTAIVSLSGRFNVDTITELALPRSVGTAPGSLIALRLEIASTIAALEQGGLVHAPQSYDDRSRYRPDFAILQFTNIAAHARLAPGQGSVLVTGLADARPRADAIVRQLNAAGKVIAEGRTDREGIAHLQPRDDADGAPPRGSELPFARTWPPRGGLIEAVLGDDRVTVPLGVPSLGYASYNPLDPSVLGGRAEDPPSATGVVFTDRGIYRPGEMVYLKGIVRVGALGSLTALSPRDSARLTVMYRGNSWDAEDDVVMRDTVLRLTEFGTVADSMALRAGLPLGTYEVALYVDDRGSWQSVANEEVRVAEYRAPEFLVSASADSTPRYGGDTIRVRAAATYLFGSPMAKAEVAWRAVLLESNPWDLRIPGAEGWTVGEWKGDGENETPPELQGVDTLDVNGHADIRLPVDSLRPSRPARIEVHVGVVDFNRQAVTASTAVPVHPASLYVLTRHQTKSSLWTTGQRSAIEIRTVRPDGAVVSGVPVTVSVVRRSWESTVHGLGYGGRWREDTLAIDTVRTSENPAPYSVVPAAAGWYELRLAAVDERGAIARTTIYAWAMGRGASWWAASPFRLPLVADRAEYAAGDEAEVVFDSPFEEAEAWVTVERERILEHRRLIVRGGPNAISLRITERHAPNVFVSVLLLNAKDRAAQRPDSTVALLRAGYAELRVRTAPKRLTVTLSSRVPEYRPRDTAEIRVLVRDAQGRGARSEVTLWAVDEGVLALSGFETPDVLDRLYRRRGLGAALWSTWPMTLTVDPGLLVRLSRQAGLSLQSVVVTGVAASHVEAFATSMAEAPSFLALRSQFRSTAFFLASVVTGDDGRAVARAALPDNLTTYRVMAAAVSGGDRFGSADTTLVVTRPLVTRPTLPRFVRAGDSLLAGAAVNARDGRARSVEVRAVGDGIALHGASRRQITLVEGKGAEARFRFTVPPRDSVRDTVIVRVGATDGANEDAVETRLAVRPDFHPRMHARLGALRDSAEITIPLPADIDPMRSRLTLRVGISPLAPMLAAYDRLQVYPYDCTEQIVSGWRALIAVWRAMGEEAPVALGGDPRPRLQQLADELARRQAPTGAIRYWRDHDWTSPWLSAYAGFFLLEARELGIAVDRPVLARLAKYLSEVAEAPLDTGGMNRYERRSRRLLLGNRVAAVDFLRRFDAGQRDAEDALLNVAPVMTWEDRLRLAEVLASRDNARRAARTLLDAAWRAVNVAGRRVDLPDTAYTDREFPSRIAPASRLLTATLAIQPDHPLLGGLIETVLQHGRAERWVWNTQDYASVVNALAALSDGRAKPREVQVVVGARTVLSRAVGAADSAASVPLDGLLEPGRDGHFQLRLHLRAVAGVKPLYYAVLVEEIPSKPPVRPDIQGVVVERWYERFADGRAVTTVQEGELVRVRLRITVPSNRQFLAVEDPLPAGLEPIDLSRRTSSTLEPFLTKRVEEAERTDEGDEEGSGWQSWLYGRWEDGRWSPWEHKAIYDDRVVYFARMLWSGTYTASYIARATTAGRFVRPPAHAEEMYNPALHGRSDGGSFSVNEERP